MTDLVKLFNQLTIQEKVQGEFWYTQARLSCNLLAVRHSLTTDKVAQVVSLLSPRNRWDTNLLDAELVIKSYHQSLEYTSVKARAYKTNVLKSYEVLSGGQPRFGQKTQSFYNCIVDPKTMDVCIDVWAARVLGILEAKGFTPKQYQAMQYEYQKAGLVLGIQPCKLQAMFWIHQRNNYDVK